MRQTVATLLSRAGYKVLEAMDGIEGTRMIRENPHVAMVLCDVNMPKMNGIEMLSQMKQNGAAMVPVVMLTTEGDPRLIEQARSAGANVAYGARRPTPAAVTERGASSRRRALKTLRGSATDQRFSRIDEQRSFSALLFCVFPTEPISRTCDTGER